MLSRHFTNPVSSSPSSNQTHQKKRKIKSIAHEPTAGSGLRTVRCYGTAVKDGGGATFEVNKLLNPQLQKNIL
jgi:hypothetical protein